MSLTATEQAILQAAISFAMNTRTYQEKQHVRAIYGGDDLLDAVDLDRASRGEKDVTTSAPLASSEEEPRDGFDDPPADDAGGFTADVAVRSEALPPPEAARHSTPPPPERSPASPSHAPKKKGA